MQHLFSLSYWFNLRPETLSSVGQTMFIALLALFLVAIIVIFVAKKKMGIYRGFFKRISNFCVGNLIIGGFLMFFNYEIIPFFSARFWLATWGIIMLVWMYFILKSLQKIKLIKSEQGKVDEFKKYLP
jgi:glucan phosphoethanolaminetransferase (alkaline phosphatase superfamily)